MCPYPLLMFPSIKILDIRVHLIYDWNNERCMSMVSFYLICLLRLLQARCLSCLYNQFLRSTAIDSKQIDTRMILKWLHIHFLLRNLKNEITFYISKKCNASLNNYFIFNLFSYFRKKWQILLIILLIYFIFFKHL